MKLTDLLHVEHPIIQAPMLGVTTPVMVAKASNAGILGSLPVGGLSPERTLELIRETKQHTDHPFAVNLFAHPPALPLNLRDLDLMQDLLSRLCSEQHIPFKWKTAEDFRFYYYQDQIDVLLNENIRIVSFTFGQLSRDVTIALKNNGAILIGTATSLAEAEALSKTGADIICVQGIEAGGHRGAFLEGDLPQVGLLPLLAQVTDQTDLPVIAAGGIYDAKTIRAAFTLGAAGIQVGSLFIVAEESAASESYKQAVLTSDDTSAVLTRAISGRWARGIRNELMEKLETSGLEIPYYTYQNAMTGPIRSYAQKHDNGQYATMWAGQSASKSKRGTTAEITDYLIGELLK